MRSPSQPPISGSGIGYYTGSPPPVDPVPSLLRSLLGALRGPPGLRLAQTNDPQLTYWGTDLIPAILDTQAIPAKVNTPNDLGQAVIASETYGPGVPL